MKKRIEKLLTDLEVFIENHDFPDKNIVLFRRCVYALLLLKLLLIWPELPVFYRHSINKNVASVWPHTWMFLSIFKNYYHWYWLISCLAVFFAFFSKYMWWLSVTVFIICLNYFKLLEGAINNGDKLMNIFVLGTIFLKERSTKQSISHMLNNAASLLLQLYFCLLYFLNVYGKIIQPYWRNGIIMKTVWTLPYYTNINMIPAWFLNPVVDFIMAWLVMLFELVFAAFIWYKPLKKPLFIIGILFHLGIAFLLSIPDFGLTMVVGYIQGFVM